MPPAFNLSQDQTLQFKVFRFPTKAETSIFHLIVLA
jgi:hypothetical protein